MGNTISGLSNYLRTVLPDIFHRFLPSVSRDRVSSFGQLSCVIVLVFSSYFGGMRLSVSEYTETILPKGPTLIYTGDNTRMRIFWQWSSNATFQVQWGTSAAYELGDAAVDPMDTTNNLYTYDITGLTPGIRYYYRLVTGSQSSDGTFYAVPPSNATSVKFIAYGDTRTNGSKHNELAGQVVSLYQSDPGFQTFNLHVGDWVSNDSESAWTSEWFAPGYANLRTQDANLTRLGEVITRVVLPIGKSIGLSHSLQMVYIGRLTMARCMSSCSTSTRLTGPGPHNTTGWWLTWRPQTSLGRWLYCTNPVGRLEGGMPITPQYKTISNRYSYNMGFQLYLVAITTIMRAQT
jgi:hypothetical protein